MNNDLKIEIKKLKLKINELNGKLIDIEYNFLVSDLLRHSKWEMDSKSYLLNRRNLAIEAYHELVKIGIGN
jgi:hypothetical protein